MPGKPVEFFSEDFDVVRYDWDWLPAGINVRNGKAGVSGVMAVGENKQFHISGNVADGEIHTRIKRVVSDAESKKTKKTYEIHFRYTSANNYHALQVRADGFYRIINVEGGKSTTLVGDDNGHFLPIPRWNRRKLNDEIVLTFKGTFVGAKINGVRLEATDKAGTDAGKTGIRTTNGLKVEVKRLSVTE